MFDPLAFLKQNKAFTMEGLVSRDMFEHFAAEDERKRAAISQGENPPVKPKTKG